MAHKQLTEYQRYQIFTLLELGWSGRRISKFLKVSHTTVNREIYRNSYKGRYEPEQAHIFAMVKRQHLRKPTVITPDVESTIIGLLKLTFSPAMISYILSNYTPIKLSTQSIYNHFEKDRQDGGKLYQYLPFKGRAKRSDYNYRPWSAEATGRRHIDERPLAARKRSRFGDLEIDTIVGKDRKGGVLTVTDRSTRFTWAEIIADFNAQTVTDTLIKMLTPVKDRIKTITSDNGREFTFFKKIERALSCRYYFARPYASWERGTIERMNRDIRMFYPKRTDFLSIDKNIFQAHIDIINSKPRLCLNGKSPSNVAFSKGEFWQQSAVVQLILESRPSS